MSVRRVLLALLLLALSAPAGPPRPSPPPWKEWRPAALDRFPRFLEAILRGDLAAVRGSLDSGIAIEWRTATGLSPLGLAAGAGNDSITVLLVQRIRSPSTADWDLAVLQAIGANSLTVLRAIDERGRLPECLPWGSGTECGLPLEYALGVGASDEVFEFLLARTRTPGSDSPILTRTRWDEIGKPVSPERRERRARRILDKFGPVEGNCRAPSSLRWLLRLADPHAPASLLGCTDGPLDPAGRRRHLSDRLVSRELSIASIDSLLALGADPLVPASGVKTCKDWSACGEAPLCRRREDAYRRKAGFPAFEWQVIARFLRHDSAGVGSCLDSADRLLLAVATGNLAEAVRWVRVHGTDFAAGKPETKWRALMALEVAAETGDTAMTRFLLGLPFPPEARERALVRAVQAHSPALVQALLRAGTDPDLPALGGDGRTRLISSLFDLRNPRPPRPSDTAIAGLLLAHGSDAPGHPALPLGAWAARHRRGNPALFDYLWRFQPGPLDGEGLSAWIAADLEVLRDTALMNHVATRGFERRIADAICADFGSSQDVHAATTVGLEEMARTLSLLETLDARGTPLDSVLGPDWICRGGFLEIVFDAGRRRFRPAWRIHSPFTPDVEFLPAEMESFWRPNRSSWDW